MHKKLKIVSSHSQQSDLDFWLTKTYIERLEAVEFLRKQFLNFKNINEGLQRVCTITHIERLNLINIF